MANKLHYHTITPSVQAMLSLMMNHSMFDPFVLVGGTNVSLRYGHRKSIDIDMFTDANYDSIDFSKIDSFFKNQFAYCSYGDDAQIVGMGKSYFAGHSIQDAVKVDLFYTDPFIRPVEQIDKIRMAGIEDIIAMKVEVISIGGRKKDFWDLHLFLDDFSVEQMIALHKERYPRSHCADDMSGHFVDFDKADNDPDPDCLQGKMWEMIKLDFIDLIYG